MTTLRGINFGPCWQAAGVKGWFGEGYWFHKLPLVRGWLKCDGTTFVGKTTTLPENSGKMPILGPEKLWAPKQFFPECIKVNWFTAETWNAVSLTGPGAHKIIGHKKFAEQSEPFMCSFMPQGSDEESVAQSGEFLHLLAGILMRYPHLRNLVGLQINISCPNTSSDPKYLGLLIKKAIAILDLAAKLLVPVVIKINILAPVEVVAEIAAHPACDALCFTNALPFDSLPYVLSWPKVSPLAQFGGGGYSGPQMLRAVCNYALVLRQAKGINKPFNVGGGIRNARDVEYIVKNAQLMPGRDSIFFASAAMVRPWNVPSIISRAHELLGYSDK